MLPKEQRLRTKKDFDVLWKRGRAVYGRALGIRFAPNNGIESRFGVIAGLKVSKRATKRNLVRRRVREALRREFAPNLSGQDVAVIIQPGALTFSYQDIVSELGALFRRARLL